MRTLAHRRSNFALLTDDIRLPDPGPLLGRLPPGAWVIYRNYRASDREVAARRLVKACRARRLKLLVAGDADLAMKLGVGLHLPEGMAQRIAPRIRLWGKKRGRLLSVAAHSRLALKRVKTLGASAAFLSPLFATASHPDGQPLGLIQFRKLVRGAAIPVLALGGINGKNARSLGRSGAVGLATVGGLRSALDPKRLR